MWSSCSSLLLCSSGEGSHYNVVAFDASNGTLLSTFKGNASSPHTLSLVQNSFLISGQPNKCVLNLWNVRKHEQLSHPKLVLNVVPRCLAVSNCGNFMAVANAAKIMLYQFCNGVLHNVLEGGHVQPVTQLKFGKDQLSLVSAGEDGRLVLWPWPSFVSGSNASHTSSQSSHNLSITALQVTLQRTYSVSLDKTCKIHSLPSMQLLLEVRFDQALHALAVDRTESQLYVGTDDGQVLSFSLLVPTQRVNSVSEMQQLRKFATSASNTITCLAVSTDNTLLASASAESNDVSVYDTCSGQCLRVLSRKAVPNDLIFAPEAVLETIKNDDDECTSEDVVFKPLSKVVKDARKGLEISFIVNEDEEEVMEEEIDFDTEEIRAKMGNVKSQVEDEETMGEISRLKGINQQLYQFALGKILETSNGTAEEQN